MMLDTEQSGWLSVFRPHEIKIIQTIYEYPAGITSATVHRNVPEMSRATCINFLDFLAENGYVKKVLRTGKGGKHGVYSPALPKVGLSRAIHDRLLDFVKDNLGGEIQ